MMGLPSVPLQPADLVFYRVIPSSRWVDKAIGWGQRMIHQAPSKASYYHVAILGPDTDHIYQAKPPRVCNSPFDPSLPPRLTGLEYYRVRNSGPDEVKTVMSYCRSQIGEWYPVLSLLSFGLLTVGYGPYCSLLAWRAWLDGGVVLCPDERMVSPDDLAASPLLKRLS